MNWGYMFIIRSKCLFLFVDFLLLSQDDWACVCCYAACLIRLSVLRASFERCSSCCSRALEMENRCTFVPSLDLALTLIISTCGVVGQLLVFRREYSCNASEFQKFDDGRIFPGSSGSWFAALGGAREALC